MNVQLQTGKTISISVYEFLFVLKDEDVDSFFQSCVADDLGAFIENPFSNTGVRGRIETEEEVDLEDIPDPDSYSFEDLK